MNFILKTLGWLFIWIIKIIIWIIHVFIGWGLIGWIILGIFTIVIAVPVIGVIGFVAKHLVIVWLHLLGNAITFIITVGLVISFIMYIAFGFFGHNILTWISTL